MPALSPTELGYLRDQHPSTARVEWYLALAPYGNPCFTARVDDAVIERGAMVIIYGGDVGEDNVRAGMTLWVGTSAGAYDVGKVRIRSIDTGVNTLTVAENDHIEWADGLYLTCPGSMGFREIWGVYQRMTEAGGVVTFYKDYDVVYNDPPDDVLPPKANAGPPVCAWMDADGNADVPFVGDRSYTTEVGAGIATYVWEFADGVVISGGVNQPGTCASPNVVRFTTPGFRYVSLSVIDNTAQMRLATVYVPVWIFQEGVEEPFRRVEVLNQSGDPSGWPCRLRVFQTNTAAEDTIYHFPPGALVVLFTRTWFGDTEVGVGGFCHRENVRFAGWLDRETLKFDYEAGFVEFEATGSSRLLNRIPGFSFTLEDNALPSDWYEMNDLNVDRALHHLLHYHSTVNQVCHVERVGEGDARPIKIQVFPDASLYSQAQDHLLSDAQCLLSADRQGILRATQDPQFLDAGDRGGVPIVCTLGPTDWMGDVDATSPHVPKVGLTRLGGFHYDTPLLAQAPGDAPRQQEAELRIDGCILQSQPEANLWAGLALTKANNEFPQVPITLSGYWPVFDPAFQEYLRLTTTDPLGRNAWVDKRFIVRGVTFRDLSAASTTTTTLTLEAESVIQTGETVEVPVTPEPEPSDPPPDPLPPPDEMWEGPIKACIAWNRSQLGYTDDILKHHVSSITTAGTGVTDLYDTTEDFGALAIAVGDTVENMTTHALTTVASIVSASHLTLTANIGLGVGDAYHICGAEWVDIEGGFTGTIMQFLYVQTGESTVGGWVLTKEAVYWSANVLSSTPAWSCKLVLADIFAITGNTPTELQGMHACATSPGFLEVSFLGDAATRNYCVYTTNTGGNWSPSLFEVGTNRKCPMFGIEVDETSGIIYLIHEYNINDYRCFYSVDGGANFARCGAGGIAQFAHTDTRADLYRPYGGGNIFTIVRQSATSPGISADNGATWAQLTEAGYSDLGTGGIFGWYGDTSDIVAMWEKDADGKEVLLRSVDGGGSWTEIGHAFTLLGGRAVVAETWPPEEDTLIWVGTTYAEYAAVGDGKCRIRVTLDGGTSWFDKMGTWRTNLDFDLDADDKPEWAGVTGTDDCNRNCGCIPLPRVGSNG